MLHWCECHSPRLCGQACCLLFSDNPMDWKLWGHLEYSRNSSEASVNLFVSKHMPVQTQKSLSALIAKPRKARGLFRLTGDHFEGGRFLQNHPDERGRCCCHLHIKESMLSLSVLISIRKTRFHRLVTPLLGLYPTEMSRCVQSNMCGMFITAWDRIVIKWE